MQTQRFILTTSTRPRTMLAASRFPAAPPPSPAATENSTVELLDVVRWRYVCTAASDAIKAHMSYPRAPLFPGPQRLSLLPGVCWRDLCYDGVDVVHYDDLAMVVAPVMSESTAFMPGEGGRQGLGLRRGGAARGAGARVGCLDKGCGGVRGGRGAWAHSAAALSCWP